MTAGQIKTEISVEWKHVMCATSRDLGAGPRDKTHSRTHGWHRQHGDG